MKNGSYPILDLSDLETSVRYQRLIAAAPAMLEALKGVGCICMRHGMPDEKIGRHSPECRAVRRAIRLAEKGK